MAKRIQPNNHKKSKIIGVRVDAETYEFLRKVSAMTGINNVSETIRRIIEYFFLSYALDRVTEPIRRLREEFNKKFATIPREQETRQDNA